MFLVGLLIGYSVQRVKGNAVTESTTLWLGIEGEVILLVFLPGLVYLDSYNIDVHMFHQAFWQVFIFAFPMVLAGMALTALVAYYIFPYGWSFDLSMTFGSILSGEYTEQFFSILLLFDILDSEHDFCRDQTYSD